jgi:hypothetical protein
MIYFLFMPAVDFPKSWNDILYNCGVDMANSLWYRFLDIDP